ncbi:MAG TPA: aromatic ring-hydroxylating dioxygenase subunit alpha [Ktedonobacterales bacterium]
MTKAQPRPAASETLDASLRRGETLPAEWYTDPARFRAERARIFRHSWQFVGYDDQLPEGGSYLSARVGDTPLVITRDQDGALHAFVNVCRHRGSELVQAGQPESGRVKTLQCAYHAWTYNLDGTLRAAPGARDEPDFDPAAYPLFSVPVETWGPLLFVNLDPRAAPLAETLGALPQLAAEAGAPLAAMRRRASRSYDIAANWKVVVDNYLECYHCPVAHKGFTSLIDTNEYTTVEYDWFSVQVGAMKPSAQATASPGLYAVEGEVKAGFYAWLWPTFTLNVYPGHGNVSINHFIPAAVDRTLVVKDYLFVDAVSAQEEADFIRFIEQVQVEDVTLCESVQRGLGTGYYDQGRLMMCQESALRHFQRLVHDTMAGG